MGLPAIVTAGVGVRVLILTDHGVPPRRGITAADVVEQLGLGFTFDPLQAEKRVEKQGFGALAVPGMLPALLQLRAVRGDIGVRTPLSTIEKVKAEYIEGCVRREQGLLVLLAADRLIHELRARPEE